MRYAGAFAGFVIALLFVPALISDYAAGSGTRMPAQSEVRFLVFAVFVVWALLKIASELHGAADQFKRLAADKTSDQ